MVSRMVLLTTFFDQAIKRHSGLLFCQLLRLALPPDQANSVVDDGIDFFSNSFSRFWVRYPWDSLVGSSCRPQQYYLTTLFNVLVKLFEVIWWQFINYGKQHLLINHRLILRTPSHI